MSDIKSVIGILSKLINNFFNVNLKAEHYRLAKYDQEDENIIPLFWNLLNNCCDQNYNKNIILNAKLYFARLGYKNVEFYSLPEDMCTGSRELLLAFSWLLQKEKILDHILNKKLLNSEISKDFNLNFFRGSNIAENIPKLSSIEEYYNYFLWISGKINNNLKEIAEYKMKNLQLTNKVHKDTHHSKKIYHLSIHETMLLKNHDRLKNYLLQIQNITQMLDYYSRWKRKESFYWEWLLTVIKEKENNRAEEINHEVLDNFFMELRNHVKKLVTKNVTKIDDTKLLYNSDPRYVFAPKLDISLLPEPKSYTINQEKYEKHFHDISEILKLYCNKKFM